MANAVTNAWNRLSAKQRKWASIVGILAVAASAVALVDSGTPPPRKVARPTPVTRNLLTDADPRSLGMDDVAARISILQREKRELEEKLGRMQVDLQKISKERGDSGELQRQVEALRAEVKKLAERPTTDSALPSPADPGATLPPDQLMAPAPAAGQQRPPGLPQRTLPAPVQARPRPPGRSPDLGTLFSNSPPPTPSVTTTGKAADKPAVTIRRIVQEDAQKNDAQAPGGAGRETTRQDADDTLFVPAGSILSGTLITGLDAPTGQQARQDPFPSLMRLKLDAQLPNFFRLDIRECFVLMSGYGDMSSERAYLRAETLSCVREDGAIGEARLPAYATGEDGKVGVRGRVVTKAGAVVARALLAGFAEGVSQAFTFKPAPIINLNTNGRSSSRTRDEDAFSRDGLVGAAASGVGNSLDRIAQYYLDMAEEMYPVVEVDAGRQIDMIMSAGARLTFKPANQAGAETQGGAGVPRGPLGAPQAPGGRREPGELPLVPPGMRGGERTPPQPFFREQG